jgi:hypothetical protein
MTCLSSLALSYIVSYIITKLVSQNYLLSHPTIQADLFIWVLPGSLFPVGYAWLKFLGGV